MHTVIVHHRMGDGWAEETITGHRVTIHRRRKLGCTVRVYAEDRETELASYHYERADRIHRVIGQA